MALNINETMDHIKIEDPGGETDFNAVSDEETEAIQPQEFPEASVYDKRLRDGLDFVKNELSELVTMMQSHDLDQSQYAGLKGLLQETKRLMDFKIQKHRTVGFIGDSGVGKSSLINSLLDQKNFARSGGDGAACTSVVTEFRYIDDTHKDPWTVEVHFMNAEEIKELLEELLRSYRLFHCDSHYADSETSEDRQNFKDSATRAWQTIQSILPENDELTEEFLAGEHEGAWEKIMEKLESWANTSIASREGHVDDSIMTLAADDMQGCKHHLDRLMAKSDDQGNPPLWPFITTIKVFLDCPILRTGLILADLPGFRDLNYARVRATEKYMRHHCDEVFIVTNISRCCTDQSVVDIKRRCGDKPQHIICTRSEDISPEEAARGESESAIHVAGMNQRIDHLENTVASTKKSRRKAHGAAKARYGERIAELTDLLELRLLERKQFLVEQRNTRVKALLKEIYEDTKVFCVSNKLYSKYRSENSNQALAYIELSGIASLRKHCYLVPAATQLREITAFLTHQVPAHLGSLRQWVLAGAELVVAANASSLRQALDEVSAILHEELLSPTGNVNRLVDELIEEFKTTIIAFAQTYEDQWTSKGLTVCEEWAGWHHGTYAAFCRRNGTYKSKGVVGYHSWNEELTESARKKLMPQWSSLQEWLEAKITWFKKTIPEIFMRAWTLLNRHEKNAPNAIRNLVASMGSRKRNINHEFDSCMQNVLHATKMTTQDMCHGHDSSFMGGAMRPAYLAASDERGVGSHNRRKTIIHDHIETSGIFFKHRFAADDIYTQTVNQHFKDLSTNILREVDGILNDLKAIASRAGESSQSSEIPGLVGELKLKVDQVQRVLEAAQQALDLASGS